MEFTLTRIHRRRLNEIYRSAGWPCLDTIEVELLAIGLVARVTDSSGRDALRLTDMGIAALAQSHQRNRAAFNDHEALVMRTARAMQHAGRIVWTRLGARAIAARDETQKATWRVAMPDVFSIRNTSKEDYTEPIVHEIKVRRADLLSDLRHEEKRAAYLDLSTQAYYVLAEQVGSEEDIPADFGVIICEGEQLRCVRFAPKRPARITFLTWMTLAKSTPLVFEDDAQSWLGDAHAP